MPAMDIDPVSDESREEAEDVKHHHAAEPAPSPATKITAPRRSSITKSQKKPRQPKHRIDALTSAIVATSPGPPMATRSIPLLICSVGNPGAAYANTLHSAGHIVLNRLAHYLNSPQFSKERTYGNGLVSRPSNDWTLWQSTAYMNESGKGVRAAYQTWRKNLPGQGEGKLVIVHDELEKPLGAVSVKTAQGLSARGHNGLKSILAHIGNTPFVRIGIGIGRPVSRQSDDVANYVLKRMTPEQKNAVEGSAEQVVAHLTRLQGG